MKSTTAILGLFPKACGRGSLALLLLGAGVTGASAQYLYLDATSGVSGNTTLADGSLFSPPLNGTTGTDNNWEQRTTFGSSGNIFESGGENVTENAPELRTLITGLTPGASYSVYVNFWDPASAVEDWNVRAGIASNPGANTLFSAADATGDLTSTAAVLASTLTYSTAPTIFLESSRDLLAGFLGTTTANGAGEIAVFVDDLPTSLNVNRRTWYDGVSYALVVPEPSSVALAALGLAGLVWRRRQAKA
jgi:hypothetical protein